MLHLEVEWPSKENILIADKILAESGRIWRGGKIRV